MSDTINHQMHLIELTSTSTYEFDEASNSWKMTAQDRPVTEKFNQWADDNDMNPVGPPTIIPSMFWMSQHKYVVVRTLCVSTMKRSDQAMQEMSYRQRMDQLMSTVPDQDEDTVQEFAPPPSASAPPAATADFPIPPMPGN